jgi:transcriptional regulator with XRE-family HTH domain
VDAVPDQAISRAIGEEMRRAREAVGWSRGFLVTRLPSGIGARTLLSYEHGTRHLTVLRFIEVCRVLGVDAPHVLCLGLQRARIYLDNLALWVDLRALAADNTVRFRSMIMWAHNKLIEHPGGIVQVAPAGVRELATMIGASHSDLATYLSRFTPDLDQIPEPEDDRGRAAI